MDPYNMNAMHHGPNLSISANRNGHHSGHQGLADDGGMRRQMEEVYHRTVTIVIWYQAGEQPIRLQQMLPTFPYFELSQLDNLINDLGLTDASYLDTWIPASGHWEQHTIRVVRIVETQQRLLYKVRRRLSEPPLPDSECICLREELQLQPGNIDDRLQSLHSSPIDNQPPPPPSHISSPPKTQARPLSVTDRAPTGQNKRVKRSSTSELHDQSSPKIQLMNGYYMPHPPASNMVSSPQEPSTNQSPLSPVAESQSPNDSEENNIMMYQSMFYSQQPQPPSPDTGLPHYLIAPPAPAAPIPYHPHPPLKRWPNDYTVSEIAQGFHAMDLLIAHAAASGGMTQRQAFERVFGCRYVKSTVCRHRAVWRRAHQSLKEQFEAMGSDERACWGEFVRRVEGRPPGRSGSNGELMTNSPGGSLGYQSGGEDEQEGAMSPLQGAVSSPTSRNGLQNTLVFDHTGTHVPKGAPSS